jgi:hypothetical protein
MTHEHIEKACCKDEKCVKIWVTKPEGKRPWHEWKDTANLEQNVSVDWIHLVQGMMQ